MGDIKEIVSEFDETMNSLQLEMNGIGYANADAISIDVHNDVFLEGVFIRGFTAFEKALEEIFIHLVSGGKTRKKSPTPTRLKECSYSEARDILRNGQRFIDWSNPSIVRDRAKLFFADGVPFHHPIGAISTDFSDSEKIRNMIAHDSLEANISFIEIQERYFKTQRPFKMTAGHLLRTRKSKKSMTVCSHLLGRFCDAIHAIADYPS